jgi:tetratricopeptide (TPR) repeat protein
LNPLQHFKAHLESSLPQDEGEQQDPYGFQAVIAKIERAKEQEQQPDVLEPIRDALRTAQFGEVIRLAQAISLNGLENDFQRQELIDILWNATFSLFDDSAEELLAYQCIVDVYDTFSSASKGLALAEGVARALVNKGIKLGNLNRSEEAIAVFDRVIQQFSASTEPVLVEKVSIALGNRGFTLLCQAKKIWSQDTVKAKDLLFEAQENIVSAQERMPGNASNLGNLSYIEFLFGNESTARQLLTQAIQFGGEAIRQDALKDSEIYPIPQDEAFRQLVHSLESAE